MTNLTISNDRLANDRLALSGGTAIAAEPLTMPAWPPVNEATAQRLAQLYLSRNWSFNGPHEVRFSRDFAGFHNAGYGIFMANGTVTLQCALGAYGIGPGDEVIVPALTWPATAMAVLYVGATPVFVDIEPTTLCLDPAALEAAITPRTRAVIPVHLYGSMADLEAILAIAERHDLVVIEDCAHGHGGQWNGRGLGSWGHVGSFSFQQSKTMASGEGGTCLTNDEAIAERLYLSKHIGYSDSSAQGGAASGPPAGLTCYNFRGTEFQALILQDQLSRVEELIDLYNGNAAYLEERMTGIPGVRIQSRGRLSTRQSYYGFGFIFDEPPVAEVPFKTIVEALRAEGLALGPTYGTVYNHILFNPTPESYRIAEGSCPVAETIGTDRTVIMLHPWLGSSLDTMEQIADIVEKVARLTPALKTASDA
jgi:L-glutamine:2-deoxy-scyllo-inosose/3-amino-2,3-dideoxy-scyllo-inosose aminotransferase